MQTLNKPESILKQVAIIDIEFPYDMHANLLLSKYLNFDPSNFALSRSCPGGFQEQCANYIQVGTEDPCILHTTFSFFHHS